MDSGFRPTGLKFYFSLPVGNFPGSWVFICKTGVTALSSYKVVEMRINPLEEGMATHSCLENPIDRRTWWAAVRRVAKS